MGKINSNRTILSILSSVVILLSIMPGACAHSGRTDSQGGHHDNQNKSGLGSYHYHHGYSAHLHTGGYCPYTDVFPTKVSLSAEKSTLSIKETGTVTASVSPSNACSTSVSWESSDPGIVQVQGGTIQAKGYGTATITASTFNGKSSSISITVKEVVAESVAITGISEENRTMLIGESQSAEAVITPENVDNPSVVWASSDESVATVANGEITAHSAGTVTISATASNGVSDQIELTVQEVVAEKVDISAPDLILIGDEAQLTAVITPDNTTDKRIDWVSSDEAIASISPAGLLTAKAAGDVTITAIQKDVQAMCGIHIQPIAVEEIVVGLPPEADGVLKPGETMQLSAAVYPENATYPEVTWFSSDTAVASVDEEGLVSANTKGAVTIYARTADGAETAVTLEIKSKVSPAAAAAVGGAGCLVIWHAAKGRKQKKDIL